MAKNLEEYKQTHGQVSAAQLDSWLGHLQASGILTEGDAAQISGALSGLDDGTRGAYAGIIGDISEGYANGAIDEDVAARLAGEVSGADFQAGDEALQAVLDAVYDVYDPEAPDDPLSHGPAGSRYGGPDATVRDEEHEVSPNYVTHSLRMESITRDELSQIISSSVTPMADPQIDGFGDFSEQGGKSRADEIAAMVPSGGAEISDEDAMMLAILSANGVMDQDALDEYVKAGEAARLEMMRSGVATWLDDPDASGKDVLVANLGVESLLGTDGGTLTALGLQSEDVLFGRTDDNHINTFFYNGVNGDALFATDQMLQSMSELPEDDERYIDEDVYLDACDSEASKYMSMVGVGNEVSEMIAGQDALHKMFADRYPGEDPDSVIRELCEDQGWDYKSFMEGFSHPDNFDPTKGSYRWPLANGEMPNDLGDDRKRKCQLAYDCLMADNICGEYDPDDPGKNLEERKANAEEANLLMREALTAGINAFREVLGRSELGQKLLMWCNNIVHKEPINGTLFQEIWDLDREYSDEVVRTYETPTRTSTVTQLVDKPMTKVVDKPVTRIVEKPVSKTVTKEIIVTKPVTKEIVTTKGVTKAVTKEVVVTRPVTKEVVTTKGVTKGVTKEVVVTRPVTKQIVTTKGVTKPVTKEVVTTKPVTKEVVTTKGVTKEVIVTRPVSKEVVTTKCVTKQVVVTQGVTKEIEVTRDIDRTRDVTREIGMTREITRDIDRTRDVTRSVDHTREVVITRVVDISRVVDRTVDVTREIGRTVDISRVVDRTRDVTRDITREVDRTRDVTRDVDRTRDVTREVDRTRDVTRNVDRTRDVTREVTVTRQPTVPADPVDKNNQTDASDKGDAFVDSDTAKTEEDLYNEMLQNSMNNDGISTMEMDDGVATMEMDDVAAQDVATQDVAAQDVAAQDVAAQDVAAQDVAGNGASMDLEAPDGTLQAGVVENNDAPAEQIDTQTETYEAETETTVEAAQEAEHEEEQSTAAGGGVSLEL